MKPILPTVDKGTLCILSSQKKILHYNSRTKAEPGNRAPVGHLTFLHYA